VVIYVITDNTNGKQYVGQTIHSAELRFAQHCKPSETNCRLLNRAISAHGKENFFVSVLEELNSADKLDEREIYWISKLNTLSPNGYNLEGGGQGKAVVSEETRAKLSAALKGKFVGDKNPFYGKHHTDETKLRMREKHRDMSGENNPNYGREFSEEHRRRISESKRGENHPCYGKHLSEETRAKISSANKGKHMPDDAIQRMAETKRGKCLSEEHRQKLSEAHKGLLNGEKNPASKKVICVETGEIFVTIAEAAQHIGVWPETLGRHLRGKSAHCGKLHWRYYEGG
jgi:group I intron endonuclease